MWVSSDRDWIQSHAAQVWRRCVWNATKACATARRLLVLSDKPTVTVTLCGSATASGQRRMWLSVGCWHTLSVACVRKTALLELRIDSLFVYYHITVYVQCLYSAMFGSFDLMTAISTQHMPHQQLMVKVVGGVAVLVFSCYILYAVSVLNKVAAPTMATAAAGGAGADGADKDAAAVGAGLTWFPEAPEVVKHTASGGLLVKPVRAQC